MTDAPQNPIPPLQPAGLSDAELRATLYFAVGVTSESGYAAYQLAVAGDRPSTPILEPADNSGYTIGTLQTDMGQHYQPNVPGGENVPRDLVNAYQNWARTTHPGWVLTDEQVQQTISDLGRNGNEIRAQQGRPVDIAVKSHIDHFLSSDDGISWVHARDVVQVDKLMDRVIAPLQHSDVYRSASTDDQARLAAIVSKAFNQNEVRSTPFIRAIENGQYQSVAEVSAAVDNLSPRRTGDYFEQGRDKALLGADVVNLLRNAGQDNPLSSTWQNVLANPLINPALLNQDQAHPNLTSEYPTIKGLFLHYNRAQQFTESLEYGGAYQSAPVHSRNPGQFTGAGFYASGNDFVTWNKAGEGHAYIDGVWSTVDRNDLSRTRNSDQTTDLNINRNGVTERLLHVDPSAPVLRPPQQPAELTQPAPIAPTNQQDQGSFMPDHGSIPVSVMGSPGFGSAQGAGDDNDPQPLSDEERRRIIESDRPRPRGNEIQFPAPGAILPDWQEVQSTTDPQAFSTGDPDLDRLAAALFANDDAAFDQAAAQIEQSSPVQAFEQQGRDLVAARQREELQQQEMARQQGPAMRM